MIFSKRNFGRVTILIAFYLISACYIQVLYAQEGEISAAEAQKLFKANCASCHHPDKKLTGPALRGVLDRVPSMEWAINWVQDPASMIEAGDPYAQEIKDFDPSMMTAFGGVLSDEQIKAILSWVNSPPETAAKGAEGPVKSEDEGESPWWFYAIIGAILLLVSLVLGRAISILQRFSGTLEKRDEKSKEELASEILDTVTRKPLGFKEIFFNKKFLIVVGILVLIFASERAYNFHSNLGRQQGYAPTQPIAFSHRVHAGINKIDCQYCHSGARVGKSAVVPSANVCMNCHKVINEYTGAEDIFGGEVDGTAEIKKLYDQVGWDPVDAKFLGGSFQQPIEWVRIHNLPDHVYFNHAQHVAVGNIECQTCHGPVEEMDVVKQFAPLSMGWCINCHRETEVQFANNEYYSVYEQLHEDLKYGKLEKVTAATIGATECQRCHY